VDESEAAEIQQTQRHAPSAPIPDLNSVNNVPMPKEMLEARDAALSAARKASGDDSGEENEDGDAEGQEDAQQEDIQESEPSEGDDVEEDEE
jgi:hypothetical protein